MPFDSKKVTSEAVLELLFFLTAGLIFIVIKGLYDAKRNKQKILNRIMAEYGTFNKEEDFNERTLNDAFLYFEQEKKLHDGFTVDDITANDLDLDYIWLLTDKCCSAAGSACYYKMLRTPEFDNEELEKREKLIGFFSDNKDKRVSLQYALSMMSKRPGFNVHNSIEVFKNGRSNNAWVQYLNIVLLAVSVVVSIVLNSSVSLLLPIGVIIYNITTYYLEKRKTDGYIYSLKNIISMYNVATDILKLDIPELSEENGELKKGVAGLKRLKKASWAIKTTVSYDIMSIFMEYVNMILHLDLISMSNAVRCAATEDENILRVYRTLGCIDSLITVSSLRTAKDENCVPELTHEGKPHLGFTGAYHLLLSNPVPADMETDRHVLLTGSNASGKSTFLKTVALNAIFAQTIHTCFAEKYSGSFFKVITGMTLSDDIIAGESYYITEIKALKRIMDDNDETPVLCFEDEILRGTNTVERIAASASSLLFLAKQNKLVFAATHDIELTTLLKDEYRNFHFSEILEENGEICFDYKLKSGPSETRNAILMLKSYGYDDQIIDNASAMAEKFTQSGIWQIN